jgi:hypothetical protein
MHGSRAFIIGALCLLWSARADAGWLRRYDKLPAGTSNAVAALPDGGAVVLSRGFVRALLRIDKRGDVVAARQLQSEPMFLVGGEGGEIFIGSWLSAQNDEFRGTPWIARLDGDLSFRWARRLVVSDPTLRLQILGVAATRDGGVVLGGKEDTASYVLKLRSTGDLEWMRTIDPSDEDEISAVHETRDGGVVCAGQSRRGPWLVKLDRRGNVDWHRTYPAPGRFRDVLETDDGGVLAVGRYGGKALAVKTGGDGTARWQRAFNGLIEAWGGGRLSRGRCVLTASDVSKSTVLVEIGADGAVGWRKRVLHEPIARQFPEPVRLATTTDAIYLAPASSQRGLEGWVYAFRIDSEGSGACGWLGDATEVSSVDIPLPSEELSFDLREPPIHVERVDALSLTPLALTSSDVACAVAHQVEVKPPAKLSDFRGRVEEQERKNRYRALLIAKDYDALDELAAKFRREQAREDPMWWEIVYFYDAIVGDASVPEAERLDRFRAWSDARPESTAARIALAMELKNAAGLRRGSGYANTVTRDGWIEYEKLLKEATTVLGSVGMKAQDDPRYWSLLVSFARLTGEGDVREILRRAAAAGHHEPKLYQEVGFYLHPRWGGSGAEYRAFAEEAAALTRSTFGDGMYAWLAYQALFATEEQEYAEQYAFDWPRMRRGFEDIIRLNPQWLPSHHRYAFVASRFEDRKTARSLFRRPELDWYDGAESMWRDPKAYDRSRDWALRTPVEPFIESGPATIKASVWKPVSVRARAGDMKHWPPIVLQGELTAGEKVHRQVAFLVQSGEGATPVTSVPLEPHLADNENAIHRAWQRMTQWVMWPPAKPKARTAVKAIASVDPSNWQWGVAVTLETPKHVSSIHLLKQPSTQRDVSTSRRLYVVGCRWIGSRCEQTVAEGEFIGERSMGSSQRFTVGLFDTFDAESFVGGPVLDEDGYVVGVSNGPDGSTSAMYKQLLSANFLTSVMPPRSASGEKK